MFGLGFGELLLIGIIALIFIGPKQLPEVARTLAKMINEIKRAVGDVSTPFSKGKSNVDDFVKDLTSQILNTSQNPQGHNYQDSEDHQQHHHISPETKSQAMEKTSVKAENPENKLFKNPEKDDKKS